jgi:hypothetical protein
VCVWIGVRLGMEKGKRRLTRTAPAWTRKPPRWKRISPREASATPVEIMRTITASFLEGSCIRNSHEIRRIATGVNAYQKRPMTPQVIERGEVRLHTLSIWI